MIAEQLGKAVGCKSGVIVAPGTEGNEKVRVFIEHHVPVHHGGNADRTHRRQRYAVAFENIFGKALIACLQAA